MNSVNTVVITTTDIMETKRPSRSDNGSIDTIFRDKAQDEEQGDAVIFPDATAAMNNNEPNDGSDDKVLEPELPSADISNDLVAETDGIDAAVASNGETEQAKVPVVSLPSQRLATQPSSAAAAATATAKTFAEIASMNSFDSAAMQENMDDIALANTNTITAYPGSTTASTSSITAVTAERKEQLLLQARQDRIEWIHQVPLPYSKNRHDTKSVVTHATFHLPTVQTVVQYLYGQSTYDVDAKMCEQISQQQIKTTSNDQSGIVKQNIHRLNGRQIIDYEIQQLMGTDGVGPNAAPASDAIMNTKTFLVQYRKFLQTLEDPSTATIVQKLRTYIRQLYKTAGNNYNNYNDSNSTTTVLSKEIGNDDHKNLESVVTAVSSFQSYTLSIYDTILNHPSFTEIFSTGNDQNQNDNSQHLLRRCYDSFVYGHCYSYFYTLFNTSDLQEKGKQFLNNVHFLTSFVTPVHLDIHCFASPVVEHEQADKHIASTNEAYVKELLSTSVTILQSIDTYYSPYEKLQRILDLYHEINIALKRTTTSTTKLPSADDILPTFIYVILLASSENLPNENSCNLYYNLYYIEQLLSPSSSSSSYKYTNTSTPSNLSSSSSGSSNHYLRGEAGYAYTNLYSAYQFISDFETINLTKPSNGPSSATLAEDLSAPPSSLSISREAWKAAIESYQVKAQDRYDAIQEASTANAHQTLRIDNYIPQLSVAFNPPILNVPTPMDIRQARSKGELIDLNWAIRQQQVQDQSQQDQSPPLAQKSVFEQVEESLPYGFQRNYNFLNIRSVDDLKYYDVEQLLQEYHTLVRTTETLLSDRARQITRERKVQQIQKERFLLEQQQQQQQTLLLLNNNEVEP